MRAFGQFIASHTTLSSLDSSRRKCPDKSGSILVSPPITRFPNLLTDELHDIGKSSRQDLAVEMLQDITSATRAKFQGVNPILSKIPKRPRCSHHATRVFSTRSVFPIFACRAARNCGGELFVRSQGDFAVRCSVVHPGTRIGNFLLAMETEPRCPQRTTPPSSSVRR